MMPDSPIYRKAFEKYLRKGISPEISMNALGETAAEHTTRQYIWRTQGDGKVRASHAANDGVIFSWDKPPVTGNPGEAPHCRCRAEAVSDDELNKILDTLPLPSKLGFLLAGIGILLAGIGIGVVGGPLGRAVGGRAIQRIVPSLARSARDTLSPAQAKNLQRFGDKLPKAAGEITVLKGRNGQRIFSADVPAKNIPGSYARYEKVVDKAGNTISYTKTTYAPDGKIVSEKIKFEVP